MQLDNFIKEALKDIMNAVAEAQKEITSGEIIPKTIDNFKCVETGISSIQTIDFEVTVTTDKKYGGEGKLSVVAGVIGGNTKAFFNKNSGYVGKLHFKIPIKFQPNINQG